MSKFQTYTTLGVTSGSTGDLVSPISTPSSVSLENVLTENSSMFFFLYRVNFAFLGYVVDILQSSKEFNPCIVQTDSIMHGFLLIILNFSCRCQLQIVGTRNHHPRKILDSICILINVTFTSEKYTCIVFCFIYVSRISSLCK